MKYWAITIQTDKIGLELCSDAFFSLGALGVNIDDGQALQEAIDAGLIWDYIDSEVMSPKDTDLVTLIGYFQAEQIEPLEIKLKVLLEEYGLDAGIIKDVKQVDDQLWYESWKSFYRPISIGKYMIVPAWQDKPDGKAIHIKIYPGMAFGTGEHQSTQLALQLISSLDFLDKSVIDLGCGSGILGIAAALSGANKVKLIDIDEIAIDAAKSNAKLNGLKQLEYLCAELPAGLTGQADIILANLTADLLIAFVGNYKQGLKAKGKLIASGIIKERWQQVLNAFEEGGFSLATARQADDWIAGLFEV